DRRPSVAVTESSRSIPVLPPGRWPGKQGLGTENTSARPFSRPDAEETRPAHQLLVIRRVVLPELRDRPWLDQSLQEKSRPEERVEHGPERAPVVGDANGGAETSPLHFDRFDVEVVPVRVVVKELVERVAD